ncbi:hypothetical protein I350_06589 [Cryptococcus amylolentus CBS 6273]|uniref:Protection of telomeres protein 1 n=1 Tax=Cryptococcus amylolentus CBS 6273 TaxID=1296118 RepID=A0A1E3JLN7_9TREE|nr:hypothetical protein I350_06589 [Cryptococcus amylolentus CBS 6273]
MVGTRTVPADLKAGALLPRGRSITGKVTAFQYHDTPNKPSCLLFTVETRSSHPPNPNGNGHPSKVDVIRYDIQLYPSKWHPYSQAPQSKRECSSVRKLLFNGHDELKAIGGEKEATVFMVGGLQVRSVLQTPREGASGTEWAVILRGIGRMQILKPGNRNGYIFKDDPTLPMERFNATEALPVPSRSPAKSANASALQITSNPTVLSTNASQALTKKRVSEWGVPSVKKVRTEQDGPAVSGPSRLGSTSTLPNPPPNVNTSPAGAPLSPVTNSVSMRPEGSTAAAASPLFELHPAEAEISERLQKAGLPGLREPIPQYTNLQNLVNGRMVNIIAYIHDCNVAKPGTSWDSNFTIHLLDATSKPHPDDPTERSFSSCTLFRPKVSQFDMFQRGTVLLLRNATVQLQPDTRDILKLKAASGDGNGKGSVVYKGEDEFVFEDKKLLAHVSEVEKERMKAMFEWGKRCLTPPSQKPVMGQAIQLKPDFATGPTLNGPSTSKSKKLRSLSDIKPGEYGDATVKILRKEIDFKTTVEYYCTDGTEAQHGGFNRNYRGLLFSLPHNAVYVINVPNASEVGGFEHMEDGNVVTLENVHATRHRKDGSIVYTWEWKEAGADDDSMRAKVAKLERGEVAQAVERRIVALGGDVVVKEEPTSKIEIAGAGSTGSVVGEDSGASANSSSRVAAASAPIPVLSEYQRKRRKPLKDADVRDYIDATVEILHIDPISKELYVSDGTVADRPSSVPNRNYSNATFGLPHNAVYVFDIPDSHRAIWGASNLRIGNVVGLPNVNCRLHPSDASFAFSWEWREQTVPGRTIEAKSVELVTGNRAKIVKDRIAALREQHKLVAGDGAQGDNGPFYRGGSKRKRRPLREIEVGDYVDATVQILDIDQSAFGEAAQLYVSDGTEADRAETSRNYFGKTFGLPHNAVYVIDVHDLKDVQGSGLIKTGDVVTLPNVHCKDGYRYSWEWKAQEVRGETYRAKSVMRAMEHEARDVLQRIASLKTGNQYSPAQNPAQSTADLSRQSIHQPSNAVAATTRYNDSSTHILPRDCSPAFHTLFRHPSEYPISSLRRIASTNSKVNETPPRRTIAWAGKIYDRDGGGGSVCVWAWCKSCKQWIGNAESVLREQEKTEKAVGCRECGEGAVEWKYRFWVTLCEGDTELTVFCGHEAESYLPFLPPYNLSTNPNDTRRTLGRLTEIDAEVTDLIMGAPKLSSGKQQRERPWIDWTVEPFRERNGRVTAWAVFGMTRGC